jgi:hypothetical protein
VASDPNEAPIRFADDLGACDLCGAPIVCGAFCIDCVEFMVDCRPNECDHGEDELGMEVAP